MYNCILPERLTETLARAHQHWQLHQPSARNIPSNFTIAFSREAGTYGAQVAREVGERLGWPVYDRELLDGIANDLGVRRSLLESMDERNTSWLTECLQGFFAVPTVSESVYVRKLIETLLSLAAHGEAVIVGRGAPQVLPVATTLRVRVTAPLEFRIEAIRREHDLTVKDAAHRVDMTDRERTRFVREHFRIDPCDPHGYDLVLNAARLSVAGCADLVLAALNDLRGQAKQRSAGTVPLGAAAGG